MVNKFEVYSDNLIKSEEIADDRNDVGNIHDENCIAALQLPSLFSTSAHDDPQIADCDKTTQNTQETMKDVHNEANELVQSFYSSHVEFQMVFVFFQNDLVLRIADILRIFYSRYHQTACVSYRHVDGVENEVSQHPFEFDSTEWFDDANHASHRHHGRCDLRNASEGATEELRYLISKCVFELDFAEEDIGHKDGWHQICQKVRHCNYLEQKILDCFCFLGVAVEYERVE